MIGVLRNHHLGQQARCWDAFINDLRGNRSLDQGFAIIADPLATHMSFNAEHVRGVVELFTDVFADALEGATASALSVLGFVGNQRVCKFGR